MNVLFERLFCNDFSDVFVDTMPIDVIMGVREKKNKVSKALYRYGIKPGGGHCESKKIKYFGFKLIGMYSNGLLKNFILVMIELKGGNDGLNTVIPFSGDNYYKLRPGIGINRDSVLRLSDSLGLNPAMTGMMKIWQQKDLAIILGVGYPEPNRSHFRSIEIWETASNSQETL